MAESIKAPQHDYKIGVNAKRSRPIRVRAGPSMASGRNLAEATAANTTDEDTAMIFRERLFLSLRSQAAATPISVKDRMVRAPGISGSKRRSPRNNASTKMALS